MMHYVSPLTSSFLKGKYKTACGLKNRKSRGDATWPGEDKYFKEHSFFVECSNCKNTKLYKQDQITFELKFDGNLLAWFDHWSKRE